MPIVRKQLKPSDVYPEDIRYDEATDNVQSLINGVWTDNPAADPRNQTTFPPRLTANPACDAARSVVDALKNQIDQTIIAIDNASTAIFIAGLILGLFSFGLFAIFISVALGVADAMIAAGSTALEAALTEPVYHTLACILRCNMDSQGRLEPNALPAIEGQVNSQIGGLGATIINSMLSLAGEGGINNLASLGTSTGDCSDCGCSQCDLDLWNTVYLGTIISVGENYIEMEAANVAGPHGDWRVSIGTAASNVCCCFNNFVYPGAPPAGHYEKFYPCGRDFTDPVEDGFEVGFPTPGTEVWVVAVDATETFTVRFYFQGC